MAHLCISVKFLSPWYHGNPRECANFPPSPARLFQAMTQAAHMGKNRLVLEEFKEALQWLETLEPPLIICPPHRIGPSFFRYVPSNDWDCKELYKAWNTGKEPFPFGIHPSYLPSPRESHLRKRHYQPQPCVPTQLLSEDPEIHYLWKLKESKGKAGKICQLAKEVVALGWGTDLVVVDAKIISDEEIGKLKGIRYLPSKEGETRLDVPVPGFLSKLLKKFEDESSARAKAKKEGWKRIPLQRTYQLYRSEDEFVGPLHLWVGFRLTTSDGETPKGFSPQRWKEIVGWVRHAMAEAFRETEDEEWINSKILGHNESGSHPYFLPIPSVGHPHSDGFVRRIIIAWEPSLNLKEEGVRRKLEGRELVSEEKEVKALLQFEEEGYDKFVAKGKEWTTISPVILHGFDYRHGKFSPIKCHNLILQAFSNSGYEEENIESIEFQKGPLVPGTLHVAGYSVPNHLEKYPRYHIRVRFRKPVKGPTLVGIGRHYGLGTLLSS